MPGPFHGHNWVTELTRQADRGSGSAMSLPMRYAEECPARQVIDAAAAVALGVSGDEIADWRRRLAVEPTITNARAPRLGEGREEVRLRDSRTRGTGTEGTYCWTG